MSNYIVKNAAGLPARGVDDDNIRSSPARRKNHRENRLCAEETIANNMPPASRILLLCP